MGYHSFQSVRRNRSVMRSFQLQVPGENIKALEEEIDTQQTANILSDCDVGIDSF